MFCKNCGTQIADNSLFCPNCGAEIDWQPVYEAQQPQPDYNAQQPQSDFCNYLLSQNNSLFLTLCILVSASAAFGLFGGGFNIFAVLFTIFLWLIYAKSRSGILNVNQMRAISGTVFAQYVIIWVAVGLFGLCFVTVLFSFFIPGISSAFLNSNINIPDVSLLSGLGVKALSFVTAIAILIVIAVLIVVNILGIKSIHTFLKSLYMSAATGVPNLQCVDKAKVWFLVLGIIDAISSFSNKNTASFISSASMAAAYIIAYVILKKSFAAYSGR